MFEILTGSHLFICGVCGNALVMLWGGEMFLGPWLFTFLDVLDPAHMESSLAAYNSFISNYHFSSGTHAMVNELSFNEMQENRGEKMRIGST